MIAHNKTLAAQLCNEFREFFPDAAVEYFVSYYDYYQPEAYVPAQDLYIEKDATVNDEIDRLRHAATAGAVRAPRRDHRRLGLLHLRDRLAGALPRADGPVQGRRVDRARDAVPPADRDAVPAQRHDPDPRHASGSRARCSRSSPPTPSPPTGSQLFGDEVEAITHFDPLTGEVLDEVDHVSVWPASHYVTKEETIERAVDEIRFELEEQTKPSSRSRARSSRRTGCGSGPSTTSRCSRSSASATGSRTTRGSSTAGPPGSAPAHADRLLPRATSSSSSTSRTRRCPQIGGMYEGDRSRKLTLVDHGFRLPSAIDNRPLKFDEFLDRVGQVVMVSATPGEFERTQSERIVEQIVRPTGIVDPDGRGARDEEPDRRPDERGQASGPRRRSASWSRR